MRITKSLVDKQSIPHKGIDGQNKQVRIYDDTLKGFGFRITSGGSKSFFIEKRIGVKLRRITIGQYPALTVEQARKEAQKLLGLIATGIDPLLEKQEARVKGITLHQVFIDYLAARKNLKQTTIKDYQSIIEKAFGDWKDKPLANITKDKVSTYHKKLGEKSQARSNLSMRLLRALFTFAASQYENSKGESLFLDNPVKRLSHTRAWFKVDRRTSVIKQHELGTWYAALQEVSTYSINNTTPMICDYLLLILFTGLRREEAARLQWSQIDFNSKSFTITDTKNHNAHTLPLSGFLYELLDRRFKARTDSQYVFPGTGKHGYLVEPRKVMNKITEICGIQFTLHDLRRTFITLAESLDIPAYALKKLLNHQMKQDVTAGYIIIDLERLRQPMQLITNKFCALFKNNRNIINMNDYACAGAIK